MAKQYDTIDEHLATWIARQTLFFVASAPLDADGHVNVSPKGPIGSLRVLGPATLAYLDIYGSGAETIAHLRENGRIVVMLCAFSGPPRILRLHGRGEVLLSGDDGFADLLAQAAFEEPSIPEARRAIVRVELTRIADSCGYGVPLMTYDGERPHNTLSAQKRLRTRGPAAIETYIVEPQRDEHRRLGGGRSSGLAARAVAASDGCHTTARPHRRGLRRTGIAGR